MQNKEMYLAALMKDTFPVDFQQSVAYNLNKDVNKQMLDVIEIDFGLCESFMQRIVDVHGHIQPRPSYDWFELGYVNIQYVLLQIGLYTAPTTELIDWLDSQISDDPQYVPDAIEICCGHGVIGRALGIPITDSMLQAQPAIQDLYRQQGQPTIQYDDDVKCLTAVEAIKKYRPMYVIASYATHKWKKGQKTGNAFGVDNFWVANNCYKYFLIGNDNIHNNSEDNVFKRKHETYSFPWLITRGDISKARIWVFESKQWRG